MVENVKKPYNLFLVEGIFALIIGLMLLVLPVISSLAISAIISIGLILVGIHKFVSSIVRRDEIEKAWLQMLIALLLIGVGIYMTMNPLFNLLVITMGIAFYLVLEGINSMSVAIQNRKILKYWWVGIISSLVQFMLAFIIIYLMPAAALLTIGVLVGVNLIFSGIALISLYMGAKELVES